MYEAMHAASREEKEPRICGEGENEDLIWTSDVVIIKHTTHTIPTVRIREEEGGRKTRDKLARDCYKNSWRCMP
jgi:hypothetical protein